MTALYVFVALTILNSVLLACPVTVEVKFRDEPYVRVGYLFFRYVVTPRPPAKEKPKKKKAGAEKPKENRLKELYRRKGLSGFLAILKETAKIAAGAAKEVFRHLTFLRFWLKIGVGGEDAAKTALDYSYVCGAVGSATSLLFGYAKYRNCRIEVAPDFRSEQSSVAFDMKARVAAFFLLRAALQALLQSGKIIKAIKATHNKIAEEK